MKQPIKDIAVESGLGSERWTNTQEFEAFLERFALTIVEKCLDQCYDRGMNSELYEGQLEAANNIERHFEL